MAQSLRSLARNSAKIICVGRNYAAHIAELNNVRPAQPFFFLKPNSSVLLPGAGPVLRPPGVELHFEIELVLSIGKTVRDLDPEDEAGAKDAIECYGAAIDMTARNVQDEAKKKGLPWTTAKGFDTFLPLSRPIPKTAVPDPHDVDLFLDVNGVRRQSANTNLMLFRLPRLLADASRVMTLTPGDLVLTGTPEGVGSVVPGDVIRAGVRVRGHEIDESIIEVGVEERTGGRYTFGGT